MNQVQVQIRRTGKVPAQQLPAVKNPGDGGMDIRASMGTVLTPGQTFPIPTGFALNIPPGYKMTIVSRSGMSIKGITVANAPGLIDTNYLDEIFVILRNDSNASFVINPEDRIAQMYLEEVIETDFCEVDEFTGNWLNDRGGGLGSTGTM